MTYQELIEEKQLAERMYNAVSDQLTDGYDIYQCQELIIQKNELYNKLVDLNKELHYLFINPPAPKRYGECARCKFKIMRTRQYNSYGAGKRFSNFVSV